MITICPQCQLTLSITASDLRVAQGQVRCGRCSTVFNALNALFEESEAQDPAALESMSAAAPPSLSTAEPPEGDGALLPDEVEPEPEDAPDDAANDPLIEFPAAANDDGIDTDADAYSDAYRDAEPEAPLFRLIDADSTPVEPPFVSVLDARMSTEDVASDPAPELEIVPPPAPADPNARAYAAGAAVLTVALLAQIVHHFRDSIATVPTLNRPITTLYAAIGQPLAPHWDVRSYEVRQLGAVADADASGVLTVRAALRNAGARSQPAPLLRLTLQDRYGNRIASRDLQPAQYGVPDTTFLAPGGRVEATVRLRDPDGRAVGFELDACLRRGIGAVGCANDAVTTQ